MTFRPQWQKQQPEIPSHHKSVETFNGSGISIKSPQTEIVESELAKFSKIVYRVEDVIDDISDPIKPYIPAIGRFLIVVTFMEDTLRLLNQWAMQTNYLVQVRGFKWGLSYVFLALNAILMLAGSSMVVLQKFTLYAIPMLCIVVIVQALGYGLVFDFQFLFRNVSILGGLIMVLSDTLLRDSKSKNREVLSSLPSYSLSPRDKHKYLLLAGRVLLVFLFIGFVAGGKWTLTRVIMSIFGFVVCAMVVVGFKARYSAMLLILVLSICNLFLNNFWNANSDSVTRDFLRYGITIYYLGL